MITINDINHHSCHLHGQYDTNPRNAINCVEIYVLKCVFQMCRNTCFEKFLFKCVETHVFKCVEHMF